MQKPMAKWVIFRNNEAKMTGNGISILLERKSWGIQHLHRCTKGISIEELESLVNGYWPKVRLETLMQVANVFGYRLRVRLVGLPDLADIREELLRFFESQQRQMPL